MSRSWSIKKLLHLWSLATVIAIIVIASIAIYISNMISETQDNLTEHVLPMEKASRHMSSAAYSFVMRQKQIVAASSLDEVTNLNSRQQVENQFEQYWQTISQSVSNSDIDLKLINDLQDYYQHFLAIDSELLKLVEQKYAIQTEMQQQIDSADAMEVEIQSNVEAIAGQINLQVSREKRAIRLSQTSSATAEKLVLGDEQVDIQKLSQSARLNALTILKLTQQIIRSGNKDNLLSIRNNDIRQHEALLHADIRQLKRNLLDDNELLLLTEDLEQDFLSLMTMILGEDSSSIYQIRLQQLHNEQQLNLVQQQSISTLKEIMATLNQLSSMISEKSLNTVVQSAHIAERSQWLISILSAVIVFGMIHFVILISSRINTPLSELRSAMHALSSNKFDTRLKVAYGNSEFALLAADFNNFASNNERLIGDLASAKESLKTREHYMAAILNGVPEAILTLSTTGVIQSINPEAARLLNATEETLLGLNLTQFFDDSEQITHLADVANRLQTSKEFVGRDYQNNTFSMWLSLNPISSLNTELWVCVISDITPWKQAEYNLHKTSSELDTILENAMVGIAFIKEHILWRVNHKFEQLFACERDTIEGQSAQCLYQSDEAFEQLSEQAYHILQQGENFEGEVQLVKQNGETFWCALSSKAISAERPQDGTIWLFEDVTKQRESDEKLRRLANQDFLTNLPNRGVFNDRLEHAIHKAHRNASRLAVFFLDLDHFKNINDSLGHKAGDILLCDVAQRLKSCVREGDTVARFGGDEFTLILEDVRSAQYVGKVAEKIVSTISEPYTLEGTEVNISPSIGISLYPADGRDMEILIKNADAAMYHAKKNGRNNFQFYSAEMNAQSAQRLSMETSLRRAVEQNEFYLHFQPQIDLRSGFVSGAEALLRWKSNQWGDVSPALFVPILEDIGLIDVVGELVLKKACEAYVSLKEVLPPEFKMSVNLSGRQFHGGQLASVVKLQLVDLDMRPENLELEITESILMDDADLAINTLRELSELGVTLAIDDFGTGYSSLSYLKRFPLDVLKVDRSFVRDVNVDEDDAAIVDAILEMSRRLSLDVVAEGVETSEQLAFLQAHDCHRVQGYFFSKPLDFEAFSAFVEQGKKYV